jgi:hypothetical protein
MAFAKQVQAAQLERRCARLLALCISEAVAQAAAQLSFAEVRIAETPNQEGMLALLG